MLVKKEEPIEVQEFCSNPALKAERELEDIILLEDIPFNQLPINQCQALRNLSAKKNKKKNRVVDTQGLPNLNSNSATNSELSAKNLTDPGSFYLTQIPTCSNAISTQQSLSNFDILAKKKRPSLFEDDPAKKLKLCDNEAQNSRTATSDHSSMSSEHTRLEPNRVEKRKSVPNNTPKSSKSIKSKYNRVIAFECKELSMRDPRLDKQNSNAGYLGMRRVVIESIDLKEISGFKHSRSSKSTDDWFCDVCNIKMVANEKQIQTHLNGRNHLKRLRSNEGFDASDLMPNTTRTVKPGQDTTSSLLRPKWQCPVCHINVDESILLEHIKSEKHRKNLPIVSKTLSK